MTAGSSDAAGGAHSRSLPSPRSFLSAIWALIRGTTAIGFRYRVTGLAAEAGFFALLSLPPLVLGLVGSLGYLAGIVGDRNVERIRERIVELASNALVSDVVRDVIVPTLDDVLQGGRFTIVSLSFLVSLWSGSRALNVYVDAITIMYGQSGRRHLIRTRALSFSLYVIALLLAVVVAPVVLLGPALVSRMLPDRRGFVQLLYWPLAVLLAIAFLTTLYHVSVPRRSGWLKGVPGAVLALVLWSLGSVLLRLAINASVGGSSIYGPLAAPIVVLLWLYVLAISVLIGAALNAAIESLWAGSARSDATPAKPSGV